MKAARGSLVNNFTVEAELTKCGIQETRGRRGCISLGGSCRGEGLRLGLGLSLGANQ